LAVIPEAYAANIENVQTTGNFEVNGEFKGVVDEEHIPTFKIAINSENASFKYPDLPKSVRNVYIDTEINNETGIAEDTYVNINRLSFLIDEDKFNLNAKIRELMGNTEVNAHMDGRINLANISQAYPVPDDYNLKGVLNADVTTAFDMASLEKKQYQNTRTTGKASVSGFEYASEELKNPVAIKTAGVSFNPDTVTLDTFQGKTGSTDFNAKGTLTNLLGFMFNDENIEGNFTLSSNQFALNDFMVEETEEAETGDSDEESGSATTGEERIKIPSFLDCTIDASANTVVYDNLNLKNVKGTLVIKDETATVKNLTSNLFGGTLGLSGSVSTKQEASTFDVNLGMNNFSIGESFAGLELFKVLTPLAKAIEGKLNSDIKISGNLKDDFTPNLATISGNLLAEILNPTVDTEKTPLILALDSKLNFLDAKEINLNGLKTALTFDNGTVKVKPFTLNYKDIAIDVNGSHSFDKKMDYSATLNVPAKYLGTEVNKLIAQMNDESLGEVTVPVTANIEGNFTNPSVSTDLTSSVKTLTTKLVEMQKQKLVNQGKDKVKDLLSDALKKDESDTTATNSEDVSETIGKMLGGSKDTLATDSAKAKKNDDVEKAAKSILGGLLGKKKKDTVN